MVENKFKDVMRRWRTMSLFKELAVKKDSILFTFESARKLYIECNDPTGYKFSTTHLGGWAHWQKLRDSPAIRVEIDKWEEELEVKLRAESVSNMMTLAVGERGYQANKFLIDKGWIEKKAGRPTKAAIQKKIKEKANEYQEFGNVVDLGKGA